MLSLATPEIEVPFGDPTTMQIALSSAKRSVLEIGIGIKPPRDVPAGTVYVGHNIDPRQHYEFISNLGSLPESQYTSNSVYGLLFDFRKFGTKPVERYNLSHRRYAKELGELVGGNLFDELVFTNVFGETNSKFHYARTPSLNPNGSDYIGNSDIANKHNTLRVSTALLKKGGTLTIKESLTPEEGLAIKIAYGHERLLKILGYSKFNFKRTNMAKIDTSSRGYELKAIKK